MSSSRIEDQAHEILHRLWTKAVGNPNYNKEQWMELERILGVYAKLQNEAARFVKEALRDPSNDGPDIGGLVKIVSLTSPATSVTSIKRRTKKRLS